MWCTMSGECAEVLRGRALGALRWAEEACEAGDYDICALMAEHGAQLYLLKSLVYRVRGEEVRGHSIEEPFGVLAASLMEQGLKDVAEELAEYSRRHRRELAELSEAHTRALYGLAGYGRREAELVLGIAKYDVGKLREVEVKLFG